MAFNSGSGGSISTASDVLLNSPAARHTLSYDAAANKWSNAPALLARPQDYASFNAALQDASTNKKVLLLDSDIVATAVSSTIYTVPIVGNGSVTIGANTFWPSPRLTRGQVNTMYLNPTTGNDNNSGIDPAAPVKTLTSAYAKLNAMGDSLLDGIWKICIQAGTHLTQGARFYNLRTGNQLEIYGEVNGSGVPTTILDGTNDTLGQCFWFEPGAYVKVSNLAIRNYTDSTTTSDFTSVENGYGIIMKGGGSGLFENLRISNCSIGISIVNQSSCIVKSSVITDCNSGVVVAYGSTGTVGVMNAGNTITNCTVGVHITRNAVAHVDFNTITNCTAAGLQTTMAARAAVLQGKFYRNLVGVQAMGASEVIIDTATDYAVGTANANGTARQFFGVAREARHYSMDPTTNEYSVYRSVDNVTHSGTTTRTPIVILPSTVHYREGHFVDVNRKLRLRIMGATTGAGTKTIQLYKNDKTGQNAQPLSNVVIPAASTGNFVMDVEVVPTSDMGVQWVSTLSVHQQLNAIARGTYAVDTNHTWIFRLYATLADQTASVDIYSLELFSAG